MSEKWDEAQRWESAWWTDETVDCTNTFYEESKQHIYAKEMGIPFDTFDRIDLRGRSVIDVGGGPSSMLLKTIRGGRRMVVDPLADAWPSWVRDRYEAAGIEVLAKRGEDLDETGWDEAWIYNVLQHCEDPAAVVRNAMRAGRTFRIFEWIKTGIHPGHIHDLTKEFLEECIGGPGREIVHWWSQDLISYGFTTVFPGQIRSRSRHGVQMRFHIPAVPHTVANQDFLSCPFTSKAPQLCQMLTDMGHEVIFYGCEGADVPATEIVDVVSDEFRQQFYPNFDRTEPQFHYDLSDEYHLTYNARCVDEISKRKMDRDFILCLWGQGHAPIGWAFPDLTVVEASIGYSETFARYRIFESYAWLHWVYGRQGDSQIHYYDSVIPNAFDPSQFTYNDRREDWLLYLGRIIPTKGIGVAVDLSRASDVELVVAGQGDLNDASNGVNLDGAPVRFVGYADMEKRRNLLSRARALVVPTMHTESFCRVVVEAAMSGCPVISVDHGAMAENVLHGITGYRCRTMDHLVWAARNVGRIDPANCRRWAIDNYSMDRVGPMYQEYFDMLYDLWGKGWYSVDASRESMDWLQVRYPS